MKKVTLWVFLACLSGGLLFAPASQAAKAKATVPMKAVELREALRDLWIGHIFWVRNVALVTRLGDAEAAKAAEEKAVQNAKDIAVSIVPFYGKDASEKLFGLLAGHYGAIKEFMNASYTGDKGAKDAAADKLKNNAEEIAAFLSSANLNWPKATLVSLLVAHGGHHMAQIDNLARKDFAAEAELWDAMKKHIYVISDALAGGIVKQFPKKFRR